MLTLSSKLAILSTKIVTIRNNRSSIDFCGKIMYPIFDEAFSLRRFTELKMNKITDRKILFVDDDRELLTEMTQWFENTGNTLYVADTLSKATEIVRLHNDIDMIILDMILPDGSGLALFEKFDSLPPVIVMSDLGHEDSVLSGFEAGVCDYIVKPCSMKLLEARMKLRFLPSAEAEKTIGGLTINASKRTVFYCGNQVPLTSSEFNILWFLVRNRGVFFHADKIYEKIWQAPSLNTTTIRRHLSTLRQKLKEVSHENLVVTEFGKGYAFVAEGKNL